MLPLAAALIMPRAMMGRAKLVPEAILARLCHLVANIRTEQILILLFGS